VRGHKGPRFDAAAVCVFVVERIVESDREPMHKLALIEEALQRHRGELVRAREAAMPIVEQREPEAS